MATARDINMTSDGWVFPEGGGQPTFEGTLSPISNTPFFDYKFEDGATFENSTGQGMVYEPNKNGGGVGSAPIAIPDTAFADTADPLNPATGLRVRYAGGPGQQWWVDDKNTGPQAGPEIRWKLPLPRREFYEELEVLQPINYHHHTQYGVTAPAVLDTAMWRVGDTIWSSYGTTGEYYGKILYVSGDKIWITDTWMGYANPWNTAYTITNSDTGASFTPIATNHTSHNGKFSSIWGDDYSYGGALVGTLPAKPQYGGVSGNSHLKLDLNIRVLDRTQSYDGNGDVIDANGDGIPDNYVNGNGAGNSPEANEVAGSNGVLIDKTNNGKRLKIWIYRKRATSATSLDGEYQIWTKKHDSPPELIFKSTGLEMYNEWKNSDNAFEYAYLFGNTNHVWADATTDYYLLRHAGYLSKPQELIDAGV